MAQVARAFTLAAEPPAGGGVPLIRSKTKIDFDLCARPRPTLGSALRPALTVAACGSRSWMGRDQELRAWEDAEA